MSLYVCVCVCFFVVSFRSSAYAAGSINPHQVVVFVVICPHFHVSTLSLSDISRLTLCDQ